MLPYAPSTHTLEKVEISAGYMVTGTAGFRLGNKEKPVHLAGDGYLRKMEHISCNYIVFWDEGDKRAWLVNGASAMLHILRASLESSKRKFQSAWLLDPSALGDAPDMSRSDYALQVLTNQENRNLQLYIDKTEVYEEETEHGTEHGQAKSSVLKRQTRHYLLEDQVNNIFTTLEQLMDYQVDARQRDGLQINPRPRRQLEGWDFRDVVKGGGRPPTRVATLQAIGKGWVDFIGTINAVTLFGRGFGELIQPKPANTASMPCARWSLLPTGKDYLAACMSDIREIMAENGDPSSNPRRLCDDVIWYMKKATFDPCPCIASKTREHHDPVQVLFPSKFNNIKKQPRMELEGRGAVIFSHNNSLHWYWKDPGEPAEESISQEPRSTENGFYVMPTYSPSDPQGKISQASKRRLRDLVFSIVRITK